MRGGRGPDSDGEAALWLSVIRRRTVLNPDSTAELLTVNSIENY